ncbi:hypothetical protein ACA910_005906 [Epithemia clementina (nom. ined.)]
MTAQRRGHNVDVTDRKVSFSIDSVAAAVSAKLQEDDRTLEGDGLVLGNSSNQNRRLGFGTVPQQEPKITDDSGHLSEGSYDLAWDRDRGWSRARLTNMTASDHSLPLDDLNKPIRDDLSDSLLEEIAGIDDFAQCSFEIDELNVSSDLLNWKVPNSPLQDCNHAPIHRGDDELSFKREIRRRGPSDIITEREVLDGPSPKEDDCVSTTSPSKKKMVASKEQVRALGEMIQSIGLASGDDFKQHFKDRQDDLGD